jgi:rubrerythrin
LFYDDDMGLFTGYLAYRHGKKKAERKARERDAWSSDDECENCGYLASQHNEEGRCPSYD